MMAVIKTYPITIVDVFAEKSLAGNQLAVVDHAADLSTEVMQAIALETNFSETTFIIAKQAGQAKVRIFTPALELPFAGHPTIGTAWVLTQGRGEIILDLKVGTVPVKFADDGIGWMLPPETIFTGSLERHIAAELIGVAAHAFSDQLPIELAENGPRFLMLPVKDLATLKSVKFNAALHRSLLQRDIGVQCVFIFTQDAYSDAANYASRLFFESHGVREDPATGSANAAFAAYLRKHCGEIGDVVVDQGVEINR
ncbi:MAG: PhzF family phenazine biosynthesis protein, partial [Gammaproteobacteria bacterium]|nr:PhzF family phenazine biosynthesis protein [Gammaproteobacteria bacterium]